jgi:hypothetical protein
MLSKAFASFRFTWATPPLAVFALDQNASQRGPSGLNSRASQSGDWLGSHLEKASTDRSPKQSWERTCKKASSCAALQNKIEHSKWSILARGFLILRGLHNNWSHFFVRFLAI